ncbi:Nitroreductase, partial [Ceraceosorus guamensis]
MASTTSAATHAPLLAAIQARRSIYAQGKRQILTDEAVTSLVKAIVKDSPSAFNSQSSRVAILFGKQHEKYWNEYAPEIYGKVAGPEALAKQQKRLEAFAGATGTVLFFEDDASLEASAKRNPGVASQFSPWSLQSSGIAQGNVWNALTAAGYGANLQHVIPSTSPLAAAELLKLPATWRIHAELVFGS